MFFDKKKIKFQKTNMHIISQTTYIINMFQINCKFNKKYKLDKKTENEDEDYGYKNRPRGGGKGKL